MRQRMPFWRQHLAPLLLLLVTIAAVYAPALKHDFLTNWDDNVYVTGNPAVRGLTLEHLQAAFTSFLLGNYAPLHILSYMLDFELWGLQASGFILTNLLCHAASSVLVYLLVARLHGSGIWALAGSLLFALHPVQVESVVWVSQRKNVLAMLFFLAALHAYLSYRERGWPLGAGRYAAALTAFVLALLTKSVTVILPLVLVALDVCIPGTTRSRRRVWDKVPFCLAALGIGLLAWFSQARELGGGRSGYWGGSAGNTALTMVPVLVRYLRMILWPLRLSAGYAQPFKETLDADVVLAGSLLLVLAVAVILLCRRRRALGFWALVAAIGLLPASQIVPLVTLMNDRYLYFPLLGIAGLAGGGVHALAVVGGPRWRAATRGAVAVALVAVALLCSRQVAVWQDAVTLWRHATTSEPESSLAWLGLGAALADRGHIEEALEALHRSYVLFPGDRDTLLLLGSIHTLRRHEPLRGRPYLLRLLALEPGHAVGLAVLGESYLQTGEYGNAAAAFRRSLALAPGSPDGLRGLAAAQAGLRR